MDKVSNLERGAVGVIGGLCLVLLKLIDAGFFYPDVTSTMAMVSYFTYVAYLILGGIVAAFLSENDAPREKVRRSALVSGLLAPSILLAVLTAPQNQTATEPAGEQPAAIPSLGALFMPTVFAQTQSDGQQREDIPVLREQDVTPGFSDAWKAAIGRPVTRANHLYVIGATTDARKATMTAEWLNVAIKKTPEIAKSDVRLMTPFRVLRIEGEQKFIVVAGSFQRHEEALATERRVKGVAIALLESNPNEKETARLLHEGVVVDGAAFFGP
jgi:hypothetical protein